MIQCRLCQSKELGPLPFAIPDGHGTWFRCKSCGSDNNDEQYDCKWYENINTYGRDYFGKSQQELKDDCRSNCTWILDHAKMKDGTKFLDIGSGCGAALDVMAELGWDVHGFEVSPVKGCERPMTIAPVFHRWHWPHQFSAVMAREVFEHIEGPENFLHECHGATKPGGIFQVQTPKPIDYFYDHLYGHGHLFIASPVQLTKLLAEANFDVIDSKEWQTGQAYLCRARA